MSSETSGSLGDYAQKAVEIAVIEDMPFANQAIVVLQYRFGAIDADGLTLNFEAVIDQLRVHVETSFNQPDIFIASAEQALDAAVNAYAGFHG